MEIPYWKDKWKAGDIAFHQSAPNRHLVKHFTASPGQVFVPLCGKSKDMLWLLEKGHSVIGVEVSEIACRDFFRESNLPMRETTHRGQPVFESERIAIWCTDLFQLPESALSQCELLYDRAAIVALPEPTREAYAQKIASFFPKGLRDGLIVSIEYDQTLVDGPPFSVTEEEIRKLFEPSFSVSWIERVQVEKERRNAKLMELTTLVETVYQLR